MIANFFELRKGEFKKIFHPLIRIASGEKFASRFGDEHKILDSHSEIVF